MAFEIKKIGDVCSIRRGASPRPIKDYISDEGMPWVKISDATSANSRYLYHTDEYIIEKGVPKSVTVEPETLIVSNSATPGLPMIMKITACVHDGWLVFSKFKSVTRDYLYYKFIDIRRSLVNQANGSVFMNLKTDIVRNFDIMVPPIDVQNKIVDILLSIDEKIETNNKINRNIEDQMQTIFSSIFYPELEAGNKVSLGDYLYIKGRIGWKGLKKDEYLDDSDFRIINGESLTDKGIDWNKAGYISEERYEESSEIMLQEGDILITKDGTIGKIGYVNILDKPTSVASGIFVVRNLKPDEISTVFIYCLLKSDYFKRFITSRTEGSVIPHLYQKDFVTLEIPLLSEEQIRFFNESVTSLFELYFTHNTENVRLASLRDALLPKLMSGELDVSELEL